MRLAVTGISGFVGRHLLSAARQHGHAVTAVVRSAAAAALVREAGGTAVVAPLAARQLRPAFAGVDAVVHLAHIGSERQGQTFQAVNVEGTKKVVHAAVAAGVPRIVMFSGLGVAGYGLAPRTTSAYFLSKRRAEQELFATGRPAVVFRPSYIVGAGDGFVPYLLGQMRAGAVELPGDGSYRMQPVAVDDAVSAILAAADPATEDGRLFFPHRPPHRVFDLVGPQPVSVRDFVKQVGAEAAAQGQALPFTLRPVSEEAADAMAEHDAWHGMSRDELDCLLCDEVADGAPLASLLGRPLAPAADAVAAAVRAALAG